MWAVSQHALLWKTEWQAYVMYFCHLHCKVLIFKVQPDVAGNILALARLLSFSHAKLYTSKYFKDNSPY